MNSAKRTKRLAQHITLLVVFLFTSMYLAGDVTDVTASHADWPATGVICTTNPSATFTLSTKSDFIIMPDGNVVHMWGFSEGDQPFQHPSPVLCVNEGDTVTVVVNNTLPVDTSLIFPGQENVLANGMPSQPVYAGTDLVSLAPVAAANGGSMTYSFVATRPGTFLYQSGTEPAVQTNMGLYGALIVRPAMGPGYAYNDPGSKYNPEKEFLIILSEVDPLLHTAVDNGMPYDMNDYLPRYFLYNGRSFPDTIASNGAPWLPNQPYGSLVHIYPYDAVNNPDPALIRYISVGSEDYAQHPHGNHGRIIARDGHVLTGAAGQDLSYEKFTIDIAPGTTVDALFDWRNIDNWSPDNPIPVTIPQLQNLTFGQFFSGSPYLGDTDTLPVGMQALNQCGEYYHISHNHQLQKITAWGIVLAGHITFTRIDPPLPNQCP